MKRSILLSFVFCLSLTVSSQETLTGLLDKSAFDTIIGGKPVSLYTISKGDITAQITNYGGFIISLLTPDKNGKCENIVPHINSISGYVNYNLGQYGPALGRFANRIAYGRFSIDGIEYKVTANSGKHTLHGGNNGFDRIVWTVEKVTKDKLVLSCILPDGTDGFPGTLRTTLTYSITNDGGLSISYSATTDKKTIVNLSNHTYFNLNGAGNGDILNHFLIVNADRITETDRSNIPTGRFINVGGTPYDFRVAHQIGERTMQNRGFSLRQKTEPGKVRNYDNNFILNHTRNGKVEPVATLYSLESGRKMEVLNDHPGLQVFTGAGNAIALESQQFPDAPNHPEFPSTILAPGKTYKHTVIYRFSVM